MRDRILGLFAILCLGLTSPAPALDLNAAALESLRNGDPVTAFTADPTEKAAGKIEAIIDISAPPPQIWKVLTDCDISMRVIGGLKSCKVLSADPAGFSDVREHLIGLSRLLPTVRSVFKSDYTPEKEIRFRRTEGDLKSLDGSWRLEPLGPAQVRLHYTASISLGIPVPSALVRTALESDMPKTMKAIRKAAIDTVGR
jgi:Polyketide cyclase / dehydrase and lipid transport